MMETITIYIEPNQRKQLRKRAKQEDTNFSEQIRNAIDQYLANASSSYSEEDLKVILEQTDKSVRKIIHTLDEARQTVKSSVARVRQKLETI
ncbi:MAG: hypothetical protein C5B54_01860 [Acidobacteria bacterium]|nr:MAG: hypothetical protein C5B54_01860 [Acidobacteriota bacterium]